MNESPNDSQASKPLSHVSYSQLSTFKTCPRKWYYEKVEKIPVVKKSAGAQVGAKHHTEIEKTIITGVECRTGPALANRALLDQYLAAYPFSSGAIEIEGNIDTNPLVTKEGVPFTGRFDIRIPRYVGIRSQNNAMGPRTKFIDHKFKRDIAMYGVTGDILASDLQVIIYCAYEFTVNGGDIIDFAHHQYPTQKIFGEYPDASEVTATLTRDDVLKKFGAIKDTVDYEMLPVSQCGDVEKVPVNLEGCSAYGGCPFTSQCSKGETKMRVKEVSKEPILAKNVQPELQKPTGFLCVGVDLTVDGKRVEVTDLGDIVQACQKEIAAEYSAYDIRLADPLGYGKYKAVLANAVLKRIDLTKNYYIRPQGMNNDVLDVLMAHFSNRVVGAL